MSTETTLAGADHGDPRQCRVVVSPFRCIKEGGHGGECVSENYRERPVRMGVWPEHRESLLAEEQWTF